MPPIATLNIKKKLEINVKSKNKFLCGISWTSNADEIGINKSITLETLKPVLKIENVEFVDLQYTETSIERENFYNKNIFSCFKYILKRIK